MQLPDLSEIKKQRKKLNITQTELAAKAKVSQSLIARLEKGTVDPSYSKVSRVFQALNQVKKEEMHAKDLMSPEVVGVRISDRMEDVAKMMNKFKVSQMPVFDKKKVVGSISEKFILDEIGKGTDMRDFSHRKVGELMDHPFPIVSPLTPMTTISKLLEHNTAVLVTQKGDIRGIITNADILKVVSSRGDK